MTAIGFIGLGNMGGPMAINLLNHGHQVTGFDLSADACARFVAGGGKTFESIGDAVEAAQIAITMLPAGSQVEEVYTGPGGIFAQMPAGALLIDCSTIDVATARSVAAIAEEKGFSMLDAPVSGGVSGAQAATLTFMVGGTTEAFSKAEPVLQIMGKTVVHAGDAGGGQAAKICNNMILGVSMIAVSEAFALADQLGLDPKDIFVSLDIDTAKDGWSIAAGNYSCRFAPASASAAHEAATRVRDKMARIAAPTLNVPAGEVAFSNGRIHAKNNPEN